MIVTQIVDEDFVNFKLPSMYIIMPFCTFKCGKANCQNSKLANAPHINISAEEIIDRYIKNDITEAIVFGGLEPFDSSDDLQSFLIKFRYNHYDPIVIYTGYTEEEVKKNFSWIYLYENIYIKYGRYIPNEEPHYDEELGVMLASSNQYARHYNF